MRAGFYILLMVLFVLCRESNAIWRQLEVREIVPNPDHMNPESIEFENAQLAYAFVADLGDGLALLIVGLCLAFLGSVREIRMAGVFISAFTALNLLWLILDPLACDTWKAEMVSLTLAIWFMVGAMAIDRQKVRRLRGHYEWRYATPIKHHR